MKLSFRLEDSEVKKTFEDIGRKVSSYKKPLQKAGKELLTFYGQEVFESQGQESGARWKQLAASTLLSRARRTGYYRQKPVATGKILIWTGRLQEGFKDQVGDHKLRIFNDVPYFKHHQTAGGRPAQRRMLALNTKSIKIVADSIFDYLESAIES